MATDWEKSTTNKDYKVTEKKNLATQMEKDKSIVMTNPEMAKDLISLIPFQKGDIVMEPCRGDGAFYNHLKEMDITAEWCEIDEGRDYLDYDGEVDITLSNPPFAPRKLFWDFHMKAMDTTRREIYWLINMLSLNVFTTKRLTIMREKGWFINNLTIVNDRRWFGRCCWVKITRKENGFLTFVNHCY